MNHSPKWLAAMIKAGFAAGAAMVTLPGKMTKGAYNDILRHLHNDEIHDIGITRMQDYSIARKRREKNGTRN